MSGRVPGLTIARASLAACQNNATGPAPVAVAVRIAADAARALHELHEQAAASGAEAHHGLSTAQVLLGYDGSVELATADAVRGDRRSASYLSPEQVSGKDVDRRSDVFSLGIVLWELLTGTQLFHRDTDAATSLAILQDPILDVRSVNPDVPPIIGDVLATALARNKNARFDNAAAFGKALAGARSSSGIGEASPQDVGRWVATLVPRTDRAESSTSGAAARAISDSVPDLDMPGAPRAHRSRPQMNAVKVPSGAAEALPSRSVPIPPSSVRSAAAAAFSEVSLAAPAQKTIPFDSGDDDDDMQIERDLSTDSMPVSTSARTSGAHGAARSLELHSARTSGGYRASGLELGAAQRRSASPESSERDHDSVRIGAKIGGWLVALVVLGGTAAALFHFGHRRGGQHATSFLPHAFDGTSANESGAIALVSLVVAVTIGFIGLRLKPHAWAIVAAGGAMLVLALAMVTVTLASTGENPTPPDGVLLVPYVVPAAALLLALGLSRRAARVLGRARGGRRLGGVPLAALAGALAFAAFELSRFAAR